MSGEEAVRAATTESLFRDVNERIAETAARFDADAAEFVCECSDPACTHRVDAPLASYADVRERGEQFLLAPGHADARIERVLRTRRTYQVVEKFQRIAAATARRLNPRGNAGR